MKLYYYQDSVGNFGDDLNPWLWPQLLPGAFDRDDGVLFVGIGSLLSQKIPTPPLKVVFGTGVGAAGVGAGQLPSIDSRWRFGCVRGPLSAQALGLESKLAITDSAALIRTIALPKESKCFDLSFMPHHKSARSANWKLYCKLAGINYIDPSASVHETLQSIQRSKIVLAEAMHGAIVSDALRVPWIPIRLYDHILEFKWQDWCQSLGLAYKPVTLNSALSLEKTFSSRLRRKVDPFFVAMGLRKLIKNVEPTLSSDYAIELATTRLQEELERLKADYFSESLFPADWLTTSKNEQFFRLT
jgi:succinoglycan biosynthesis protein ExoV